MAADGLDGDKRRRERQQKELTKLELDIECNPSAQFSARLCSLMEQEQQMEEQNRALSKECVQLTAMINSMMKKETAAHFDRQAEYSNKRWAKLFRKLNAECDSATRQLTDQYINTASALGIRAQTRAQDAARAAGTGATIQTGAGATQAGGKGEASHLRHTLRVKALERWDEDEIFNLQVAFGNKRRA